MSLYLCLSFYFVFVRVFVCVFIFYFLLLSPPFGQPGAGHCCWLQVQGSIGRNQWEGRTASNISEGTKPLDFLATSRHWPMATCWWPGSPGTRCRKVQASWAQSETLAGMRRFDPEGPWSMTCKKLQSVCKSSSWTLLWCKMGLNAAGGGQWGAKSGQTGGGAGDLYERRRRRNSNRWEIEITFNNGQSSWMRIM